MSERPVPSYRFHKSRNCATVRLGGRDFYLGTFGSPESKAEYDRLVREWKTRGRVAPPPRKPSSHVAAGPSVNEVMLAYVTWAQANYRDAEGQPTREVETMTLAFRPLKALYGQTPAATFGPLALECVQNQMVEAGLSRKVINQRIGYVKRMFRWASRKEMIDPSVYHRLLCVEGLRQGRCAAKETEPVGAVPDAHVDAILPYLPPMLQAMVKLQRLTGMRSGELVQMRSGDIDTSGPVWLYRPAKHKTRHLGRKRVIGLGPQCKAIVLPLLKLDMAAFLFSPRQAEAERDEIARKGRKTPVQPSQVNRRKPNPKRAAGEKYNTRSYYAALRFAMNAARKAGQLTEAEFWHPHQLRHSAALRIQHEQGLEAARAYLGHAKPDLTAHYAGLDTKLASAVAELLG